MTVTLYQMRQFDKWASRSAEKKRIEAQQKAIRPFLKPVFTVTGYDMGSPDGDYYCEAEYNKETGVFTVVNFGRVLPPSESQPVQQQLPLKAVQGDMLHGS